MGEEKLEIPVGSLGFITPFRVLVAGSSSCGKSELIARMLENKETFFPDTVFDFAYYFHPPNSMTPERNAYYRRLTASIQGMECVEGLPNIADLTDLPGKKLLIIDDLYDKAVNSEQMQELMVVHSHHSDISLFFTSQNYFNQGRFSKTFLRNYTDTILFDAKTERLVLEIISRQLFPGANRFLPRAMEWLRENEPCVFDRYIWIDSNPQNALPEKLRVRTRVIPDRSEEITFQIVIIP